MKQGLKSALILRQLRHDSSCALVQAWCFDTETVYMQRFASNISSR